MTASNRPNILLILSDQQSATMMSCTGNRHVQTPAMDSLAATGVRFERAYCTNSVCVPSRFSLLTGRMPSAIGMISNTLWQLPAIPPAIKQGGLGWRLRQAGYETMYGGKVHLPKMDAPDVGFDLLCGDSRDALAEACAEFIGRRHDRPFLLVASFVNPHDICYMAIRDACSTPEELQLIARGQTECRTLDKALTHPAGVSNSTFFTDYCPPLPANFEPQADEPEALRLVLEKRPFRMKARRGWSPRRWREHRWAYARLTEIVDAQIGRVLDALQHSGLADSTIVIFSSDHGDMDAAHRMEHKSTLYEEACRIPLIIRAPGAATTGRVDAAHLVSNGLDLLPTICDFAGLAPDQSLVGYSLRPLIENRKQAPWRQAVPVETAVGRAVVTERFKYVVYDLGAIQEQLTDLRDDPGEMRNSMSDACHQQILATLRHTYRGMFGNIPRLPTDVLQAAGGA